MVQMILCFTREDGRYRLGVKISRRLSIGGEIYSMVTSNRTWRSRSRLQQVLAHSRDDSHPALVYLAGRKRGGLVNGIV